jgi:hypothetical protein
MIQSVLLWNARKLYLWSISHDETGQITKGWKKVPIQLESFVLCGTIELLDS